MRRYFLPLLATFLISVSFVGCSIFDSSTDEIAPEIGVWKYDPPLNVSSSFSYRYLIIREDDQATLLYQLDEGVNKFTTFPFSFSDGKLYYFSQSDPYEMQGLNTIVFTDNGQTLIRATDLDSEDDWVMPLEVVEQTTLVRGYLTSTTMTSDGNALQIENMKTNGTYEGILTYSFDGDSLNMVVPPLFSGFGPMYGLAYGDGKYWTTVQNYLCNIDIETGDTTRTGVTVEDPFVYAYAFAYEEGTLWALSWWMGIYQIDVNTGKVLNSFDFIPNVMDLTIMDGRLFANLIYDGQIIEIDKQNGAVLRTMRIDGFYEMSGITYVDEHLFVLAHGEEGTQLLKIVPPELE